MYQLFLSSINKIIIIQKQKYPPLNPNGLPFQIIYFKNKFQVRSSVMFVIPMIAEHDVSRSKLPKLRECTVT